MSNPKLPANTDNPLGFIAKVAIASALFSAGIKYGGPLLAIAPTPFNAIFAVILPPLLLAAIFLWRIGRGAGERF